MQETVKMQRGFRAAAVSPSSINDADKTVVVNLGTGAPGLRWFYDRDIGDYAQAYEELDVSERSMRLGRMNNGAPFLEQHNSNSLDSVLGVFERVWIENGSLMGKVRFDNTERANQRWASIQNGVLRNLSIGYDVHKFEEQSQRAADGKKIYRATDWEPFEGSLVAVGFDDTAKVRSLDGSPETLTVFTREGGDNGTNNNLEGETMTQEIKPEETTEAAPAVVTEEPKTEIETQDKVEAERERIISITRACKNHGIEADKEANFIKTGASFEQVARAIVERQMENEKPIQSSGVSVGAEQVEKSRSALESVILSKVSTKYRDGLQDNPFRGASVVDIARSCLPSGGFVEKFEAVKRALSTTSDFPILLSNVANKLLRDEFTYVNPTYQAWTKEVPVSDFKENQRLRLGDASDLLLIEEEGEYKSQSISESKEVYKLQKFGRRFGLSFEAMINDDLSAFQTMPAKIARAAIRKNAELVYTNILVNNPNMADSVALFHANHGNLAGTAAALTEASLNLAVIAFMSQTSESGDYLGVAPKYLLVSPKFAMMAKKLITAITPDSATNINAFAGQFEVIVEPRLLAANTGLSWFLAADPREMDTIERGVLEADGGGVFLEEIEDKARDGMWWKARYCAAAKAIDYRGLYKNAGA